MAVTPVRVPVRTGFSDFSSPTFELPSWLSWLYPQLQTVPSPLSARACRNPAATARTPARPLTRTGALWQSPLYRCRAAPPLLFPRTHTVPSFLESHGQFLAGRHGLDIG